MFITTLVFKRKTSAEQLRILEETFVDSETTHITDVKSHSIDLISSGVVTEQFWKLLGEYARTVGTTIISADTNQTSQVIYVIFGESQNNALKQAGIDRASKLFG